MTLPEWRTALQNGLNESSGLVERYFREHELEVDLELEIFTLQGLQFRFLQKPV